MSYTDNITNWVANDLEGYWYRLCTLDNIQHDNVSELEAPIRRGQLEAITHNEDIDGLRSIVRHRIHHRIGAPPPDNDPAIPLHLDTTPLTTAILNTVNWDYILALMQVNVANPPPYENLNQ